MTTVAMGGFTPFRASDRTFYLLLLAAVWGGIFAGFIPDVFAHFEGKHVPWALVVHFHAPAHGGWLTLLTIQMSLVRAGRTDLHRRLGLISVVMIPVMVVLALWTARTMDY